MRAKLRITDRERTAEDVPIFTGSRSHEGVYAVAKLSNGDLVALDRDYEPLGYLVGDAATLWTELMQHPARFMHDPIARFPSLTGIQGEVEAIWLDLDESK
jgi:hypothetical protein